MNRFISESISLSIQTYIPIYPSAGLCIHTHLSIDLSIYLSIYLSISLSIYLSIYPYQSTYLSIHACMTDLIIHFCVSISSIYLCIHPSIHPSIRTNLPILLCMPVILSVDSYPCTHPSIIGPKRYSPTELNRLQI